MNSVGVEFVSLTLIGVPIKFGTNELVSVLLRDVDSGLIEMGRYRIDVCGESSFRFDDVQTYESELQRM